jgi:predicted SnoaL-like aldol condensation-catalyzing enzyme
MIESPRLANARGLYLEGIRGGNMREALDKYTGARYTQHSTGVRDGKDGFIEFFSPFLERNLIHDIQVVRAIEDGRFVFCHVYQSLNNGEAQWVTADLFDTDDEGLIVEHWDVIAEYRRPTESGRSTVDGPTDVEDLEKTATNKAVVRRFVDNVLIGGSVDGLADYISGTRFDQHNPDIGDGLDCFRTHLNDAEKAHQTGRYVKVHRLIGQGNFVVTLSEVQMAESDLAVFDIFRLKGGQIVEHWDVSEKIGLPETWNNSGKF